MRVTDKQVDDTDGKYTFIIWKLVLRLSVVLVEDFTRQGVEAGAGASNETCILVLDAVKSFLENPVFTVSDGMC